ncbi:MAG TPA: adenosylmethionine--8-amino-7-oxononanoate transaminase [Polyangiaceae bacterium]|nr:adenosylmethionine--8-amino-7-oxononanoate transaminase [Polyangiaceae bacterium]
MNASDAERWLAFDRQHVWHPYAAMPSTEPRYLVTGAEGVHLELSDGRRLIDGISSWWTAILGHRHPELIRAAQIQLERLPHVMFGGLTHEPALQLAERLLAIAPPGLEHVFFSDSGSVSVEVAMKMALQWQAARGHARRHRFLTPRRGYHGDTFGAMSVCDPERGMHRSFSGALLEQVFVPAPTSPFGGPALPEDIAALEGTMRAHADELCALILEPIVQNTGGVRFYSAEYLRAARRLCSEHGLLLIADEIATGFGRTGRLFACEHAGITPDILCVGKALTGGVLSLAATLTQPFVAEGIAGGELGRFMHGPTFMANPLATAVAGALLGALQAFDWRERVLAIEAQLLTQLEPCRASPRVADVRVLGAIGVVEMVDDIDLAVTVPKLVERGVWLRPFGRLLYTMPPYVISERELAEVTGAMCEVVLEPAP